MRNLYKYLIGIFILVLIFIVYTVRKDSNAEGQTPKIQQGLPESKVNNDTAIDELDPETKKILKEMSEYKPTEEEIKGYQKLERFLKSKSKVENAFKDSQQPMDEKEFQSLLGEIDWMRENNYIFLSEAHMFKLSLLEKQYKGAELESKIKELNAKTKAVDAEARRTADPTKDPSFIKYKAKEQQIFDEADRMTSFPNGMTRNEYIEQRLKN